MDRSVGYAGLGRATLLENTFRKHHIGALLYGPDQVVRANKFNTNLTGVYLGTPYGNFVALQGTGWSTNPQDYPVTSTLTLSCNEFDQPWNNPEANAVGVQISDGVKLPNIGGTGIATDPNPLLPAGNVWPKTGFTNGILPALPTNCVSGLCLDINESPSLNIPTGTIPFKTSSALPSIYFYYANEYVYPKSGVLQNNFTFQATRGLTLTGDYYGESTCVNNCPWDIAFDQHFKVDNCSEIDQGYWPLARRGITDLIGKLVGGIQIYPNPASRFVEVASQAEIKVQRLILTDVLGRAHHFSLKDEGKSVIDVSGLTAGLYVITVLSDQTEVSLGKLIIQR
jgi:hypothetical protein